MVLTPQRRRELMQVFFEYLRQARPDSYYPESLADFACMTDTQRLAQLAHAAGHGHKASADALAAIGTGRGDTSAATTG